MIDTRTRQLSLSSELTLSESPQKHFPITSISTADHSPFAEIPQAHQYPTMETIGRKRSSQSTTTSTRNGDVSAASLRRQGKEGKGRWFSQIKDWVSISEPSNQALKNYKKEAFRRAGTTPEDPRATAKLHIATATLPPEAIKPSGPGPDPEEIALRKAEQKKGLRSSFQTGSVSGGSRSSASQYSSFSSLPLKDPKENA